MILNFNSKTTKSRKYQITINNPEEKGFSHEVIKGILANFKNITYWCMCDEIGGSGTYHTHLYIYSPNAILFETIKKRFYEAHIENCVGSHQQNRDYIRKEGKYLDSEKRETNLPDTFEESGNLPPDSNKRETVSEDIFMMLEDGASNAEIIRKHPGAMNRIQHIEAARQTLREEEFVDRWRDLDVTYMWGKSGVGKTRSVMDEYGYRNVYQVTNYRNPFDTYRGQDVILFDEFRSSLMIADMLKYLDGYPVFLPCRYADKVACFTKVFIISNIPLEQQYPNVQIDEPETYQAFLRRIHHVCELSEPDDNLPF